MVIAEPTLENPEFRQWLIDRAVSMDSRVMVSDARFVSRLADGMRSCRETPVQPMETSALFLLKREFVREKEARRCTEADKSLTPK